MLIWQDAQNFLRLERATGEAQGIYVWSNRNGSLASLKPVSTTATELYLRITRIGSLFICHYSETGDNWAHLTSVALPFQPNLAAGLALVNEQQDNPIQADFDQIIVAEPDYQPIFLPLISK